MGGGSQKVRPTKNKKAGGGLGSGLIRRVNTGGAGRGGGQIGQYAHMFTTDLGDGRGSQMQSVLEMDDLQEMMEMAELNGRTFQAERQNVQVISLGPQNPSDAKEREAMRQRVMEENIHKLKVPRRPPWTSDMSADELDVREREYFLHWRRDLATLEETDTVTVTPFEKNLQVWRQLWRVLERSDLVCQVVDARDPLRYRCEDLEDYVLELSDCKSSLLLLNKADMLTPELRKAWAKYFDEHDVDYIFWSAKEAAEEEGDGEIIPIESLNKKTRSRVVGRDELMQLLEERAAEAAGLDGSGDPREGDEPRRVVVGFVGYPNVGKSSTLNALIGAKKSSVGPQPGKTKHFQTFNISDTFMLADCPGLVFPSFADTKADMVVAGVIPIDKLTDVVTPVHVVAQRVPRSVLEQTYGFHLPRPAAHEDPHRQPTGSELLRCYAASRGLTSGGGLPDETRAGRTILKDFTSGKLLHCVVPPGCDPAELGLPGYGTPGGAAAGPSGRGAKEGEEEGSEGEWESDDGAAEGAAGAGGEEDEEEEEEEDEAGDGFGDGGAGARGGPAGARTRRPPQSEADAAELDRQLLLEMQALGVLNKNPAAKAVVRAPHKLQKKGKKEKMRRLQKGPQGPEGIGGALITGKKGGLMPAALQMQAVPEFLPSAEGLQGPRSGAGISSGGSRTSTTSARSGPPAPRGA